MTARRFADPATKVTMNLDKADYERFQALYASSGAAAAIRALMRQHLQRVDARLTTPVAVVAEIDLDMST